MKSAQDWQSMKIRRATGQLIRSSLDEVERAKPKCQDYHVTLPFGSEFARSNHTQQQSITAD
jgi:hypothetical protein